MYLNYKSVKYPCSCRIGKTMQYSGLPEDFPSPVEGEVILCADDGFVMREDKVEDYLRQTFENGVLTLTNAPEPVGNNPYPSDEPTMGERVAALEETSAQQGEILNILLSGETEEPA